MPAHFRADPDDDDDSDEDTGPTRRSFLSSIGSWCAGLPLLSAWLARPVESRGGIGHWDNPRYSTTSYSLSAETFVPPGESFANWIPVTEIDRLPECDRALDGSPYAPSDTPSHFGLRAMSREVLVASGIGVIQTTRWLYDDGHYDWGMNYTTVTYWAEMPGMPDTGPTN